MTDEPNEREQDRAPASSLKSQPKFRLILIIAITAALIAGGWWYYRHVTYGQYMQSTDNAYVAADSVVVSSKVAGYVDAVLVSENGWVSPGEALVQLDVRDYRAQAQQARAQIAATLPGAGRLGSLRSGTMKCRYLCFSPSAKAASASRSRCNTTRWA